MVYSTLVKPGYVAAGPRHASDETGTDWVRNLHEDSRYGRGRLPQRPQRKLIGGQNDIGRQRCQFRCTRAEAIDIAPAPAIVDASSAAVPAGILKHTLERRGAGPLLWIGFRPAH
jgi:hypothetical protein